MFNVNSHSRVFAMYMLNVNNHLVKKELGAFIKLLSAKAAIYVA